MTSVGCIGACILSSAPSRPTGLNPKSTILIFSVLLFGALFGFCQTVRAEADELHGGISSDSVYSALVEFVKQTQPTSSNSVGAKEHTIADGVYSDGAYSALREFAQRIGADQSESLGARPKFAEADDALWRAARTLSTGRRTT